MQIKILENKIYELRGLKIMLDFDLAELYGVETKNLNLAVKRNIFRFPKDFMFRLTKSEWKSLRLQIESLKPLRLQNETLKNQRGKHSKYLPYAFTEQGVSMLSSVLNSKKAVKVNIGIMRAFVLMRQFALTHKELTGKLKELENKYDKKFKTIYEAIDYLLKKDVLEKEQKERRRIGYK